MSLIEVLVGLIAACVVLAVVARSVGLPAAVALVFGGMALALLPGVPRVELDPHIVLTLFLPPLLQVSALRTDWKAFRIELRPILLLALGLVLFTAIAIVRERERGNMELLIATPLTSAELMIGKVLPYIGIGTCKASLIA